MRVEDNLALITYILKRHGYGSLEYEDAFQEGALGLMKAVRTWDESKGTFRMHAYVNVKRAIQDAKRNLAHDRRTGPKYRKMSLDEWMDEPDAEHDVAEPIDIAMTIYPVKKALEALGDQDRYVLRALYEDGLYGYQVAEQLGVSESRVSQIRKRAIRRLAKELRRLSTE